MATNNYGPQRTTQQSRASVVSVETINRQTRHHIFSPSDKRAPSGGEFIFFNCLIDAWA